MSAKRHSRPDRPLDGGAPDRRGRRRAVGVLSAFTMAITLHNTGAAPAEFAQILPLPAGVYVSGFRLHIEGRPVSGRITEKKTALWVYTMIRDSGRRDPGLLFYNAPDELELRVFPVVAAKPSVVEIDFILPSGGGPEPGGSASASNPLDPAEALTPEETMRAPGFRASRTSPTPVRVPPVPMRGSTASTAPSVSVQISPAVVSRCEPSSSMASSMATAM